MKVLCLLLLFALPNIALSCSCVEGAFSRPRIQAIENDFCSQYSRDVYIATVVGAKCNCILASGDAKDIVAYNIYLIDETATYTVNILATNLHVFTKYLCAYKVLTVSVVTPVISTRLL